MKNYKCVNCGETTNYGNHEIIEAKTFESLGVYCYNCYDRYLDELGKAIKLTFRARNVPDYVVIVPISTPQSVDEAFDTLRAFCESSDMYGHQYILSGNQITNCQSVYESSLTDLWKNRETERFKASLRFRASKGTLHVQETQFALSDFL